MVEDYSLERELSHYIFLHKSSIVLGCLLKYYTDVANMGVTVPEFMQARTPEEQAKEHYYKLLENKVEFNKMYDKCWEKYGALLP